MPRHLLRDDGLASVAGDQAGHRRHSLQAPLAWRPERAA